VAAIDPYVSIHKVASSDLKYVQLLDAIKATGKEWVISTGGAHLDEIKTVCALYNPTAVLECVAQYPAEASDHSFGWMGQLPKGTLIGLSDHSMNPPLYALAAGIGCTIFEFHFDGVDHEDATPDSPVSLSAAAAKSACDGIKDFRRMLNSQLKVGGRACELNMLTMWRRRLIATRDICEGEQLTYGVNFGSFRSKVPDTQAAGPENWLMFDGEPSKRAVKQGGAIY
jgi:sialic acid synthase SpsE